MKTNRDTSTASERDLRRIEASHVERATPILYFDYDHQAWVKAGVYQDCGHPQEGDEYTDSTGRLHVGVWEGCSCYGREHAGERAPESSWPGPIRTV